MGLNWSEGLKGLSGGIGMYMQYQAQLDERKYQEQQQAAQQEFQKSLVELQGSQQRQYLGEQLKHDAAEAEKDRTMRLELAAEEAERWSQTYQLDKEQLEAQLEANSEARNDVKLVRELELLKLDYSTAASQIAANNKAAMEQIEALAKDPTLAMNPEALGARREAILTQLQKQNKEPLAQLQTVRTSMYGKLGMEPPPLGGESTDEPGVEKPATAAEALTVLAGLGAKDPAMLRAELKRQGYPEEEIDRALSKFGMDVPEKSKPVEFIDNVTDLASEFQQRPRVPGAFL